MLKKGRQEKRFKALVDTMRWDMLFYFKDVNLEALHHFRLQVKKLRALFLLTNATLTDPYQENLLHSLRAIYKHAGRIRSAHINAGLIEKYATSEWKDNSMKKLEANEVKRFHSKQNTYIKTIKLIRGSLIEGFRDIPDKEVTALFKKRLKKLARSFSQANERVDPLHGARKEIKNLLYLYQMLPKTIARKLHLNDKYLNQLQEAIGKWHDVVMAHELLETTSPQNSDTLTAMISEKGSLYQTIRDLTKDFKKRRLESLN